jgi:hypothetical protein
MSPQAEHDVNGVAGDWNQFKKQLAAALLCAVYSFVVAFALMKGLMVVMDVVPDVEMVRSGLARARRFVKVPSFDATRIMVWVGAVRTASTPRAGLFHARHARAQH